MALSPFRCALNPTCYNVSSMGGEKKNTAVFLRGDCPLKLYVSVKYLISSRSIVRSDISPVYKTFYSDQR